MSKKHRYRNNTETVQQDNTQIAGGIAMGVLATLTDAANDIAAYLTSGEATTEGILSGINEILDDLQTSTANFKRLTGNFDRVCENFRQEASV